MESHIALFNTLHPALVSTTSQLPLVEIIVPFVAQIHNRLAERRIYVEKEVLKYGEAPAGIKEVFELCRGFERAYVSYCNVSDPDEPMHLLKDGEVLGMA